MDGEGIARRQMTRRQFRAHVVSCRSTRAGDALPRPLLTPDRTIARMIDIASYVSIDHNIGAPP